MDDNQRWRASELTNEPDLENENEKNCWEVLEQETRFKSYQGYLNTYWPRHTRLMDYIKANQFTEQGDRASIHGVCYVYDIFKNRDTSCSFRCDSPLEEEQCTQLLRQLQSPPTESVVRVLMLQLNLWAELSSEMINVLGLALQVHPHFFETLIWRKKATLGLNLGQMKKERKEALAVEIKEVASSHVLCNMQEPCPLQPTYFTLGSQVIMITKTLPPMILICEYGDLSLSDMLPLGLEMKKNPSIPVKFAEGLLDWKTMFAELRDSDFSDDAYAESPYRYLYPLLRLDLANFRSACCFLQSKYIFLHIRDNIYSKNQSLINIRYEMQVLWTQIRRRLEDFQDSADQLRAAIKFYGMEKSLEDPILVGIKAQSEVLIDQAKRIEAEIREYLSFQSGRLALRESQRSAELAAVSISEAKRVKIVTILAFIYIPLNLVTSYFGMNLQELAGNTQTLSTFFATAATVLIVTAAIWRSMVQLQSYFEWRQKELPLSNQKPKPRRYSMSVRLAMLIMMMTRKRGHWLLQTNAWIGLLTNDYIGGFKAGDPITGNPRTYACEYIEEHMNWDSKKAFHVPVTNSDNV